MKSDHSRVIMEWKSDGFRADSLAGNRTPLGRGPGVNRRIYLPVSSSPGEGFSASFTSVDFLQHMTSVMSSS